MLKKIAFPFLFIVCISCSSTKKTATPTSTYRSASNTVIETFTLTEIATDETYGYKAENPVKVGGAKNSSGPANERKFLDALLGPNGEEISYHRQGSCCPFKTPNGMMGSGLLDKYEIKYEGLDKPIIIYINMYDDGELKAPKGFTFRK